MKKIVTLLLAAGTFITASAQTSREEARRVILGGESGNGGSGTSTRGRDVILGGGEGTDVNYPANTSRQAEVRRINREYDAKVISIRNNNTLTQEEKEAMIRQLEKERARKIKQVNKAFSEKAKDDDNEGRKKDKSYKSNKGKHKGWTKGKGNKHRDRDDD